MSDLRPYSGVDWGEVTLRWLRVARDTSPAFDERRPPSPPMRGEQRNDAIVRSGVVVFEFPSTIHLRRTIPAFETQQCVTRCSGKKQKENSTNKLSR